MYGFNFVCKTTQCKTMIIICLIDFKRLVNLLGIDLYEKVRELRIFVSFFIKRFLSTFIHQEFLSSKIICKQLYGFKYSNLILIISTQFYGSSNHIYFVMSIYLHKIIWFQVANKNCSFKYLFVIPMIHTVI